MTKDCKAVLSRMPCGLRDAETHGHSERVVTFSLRLGRELGLDKAQMTALEFGSLLHDIGMLAVPPHIGA